MAAGWGGGWSYSPGWGSRWWDQGSWWHGRWSQEEKVPWEKPEVPTEEPKLEEPERPSDRSDRPSDDGGWVWSGWSSSWYGNGRPWSSWSSYPYGYGYGGYGYSGYSSWDERWARPDAPEAKQDDSQNRQERWSQAFLKDRQELQEGAWWKSERDERSKENIASEARQAEEGSQEPKWVPIAASSGLETSSATGTPQEPPVGSVGEPKIGPVANSQNKEIEQPSHQNEEWYQKWLRRQQEKEANSTQTAVPQAESFVTKAKKVEVYEAQVPEAVADPDTQPAPLDQEMSLHSIPEPEGQPVRHPHENEEWYQKWLRRQKNQPSHVIDIGAPQPQASTQAAASSSSDPQVSSAEAVPTSSAEERRVCPDDGKTYTFDELKKAYAGQYSEEDLTAYWRDAMATPGTAADKPPESKKEDYKQEEWYQKWLRRQQNKNRQIIEIG
ncbi:unnamed protein product [Symbiodinium pilosum]|uniref:Uncharacterized protein n=1 Tax=Symbiodinium pilosum TaxID=2952 RepID=A0A812UFW5_SYMPI|nr:unnamed protein product [Symbiodinium pilosum]